VIGYNTCLLEKFSVKTDAPLKNQKSGIGFRREFFSSGLYGRLDRLIKKKTLFRIFFT